MWPRFVFLNAFLSKLIKTCLSLIESPWSRAGSSQCSPCSKQDFFLFSSFAAGQFRKATGLNVSSISCILTCEENTFFMNLKVSVGAKLCIFGKNISFSIRLKSSASFTRDSNKLIYEITSHNIFLLEGLKELDS